MTFSENGTTKSHQKIRNVCKCYFDTTPYGFGGDHPGVCHFLFGVRIVGAYQPSTAPPSILPEDSPPAVPLIDAKFEKTETSELTCDVKGSMTLDIVATKTEH